MSPQTPFESMALDEMLVYGFFPVVLVAAVVIASTRSPRHPVAVALAGAVPVAAAVFVWERVELVSLALCAAGYAALGSATLGVATRRTVRQASATVRQIAPTARP